MKNMNGYVHRLNRDGGIESICLGCYLTIATAKTEEELAPCERSHICDDDHLAQQREKWKQRLESTLDVRG